MSSSSWRMAGSRSTTSEENFNATSGCRIKKLKCTSTEPECKPGVDRRRKMQEREEVKARWDATGDGNGECRIIDGGNSNLKNIFLKKKRPHVPPTPPKQMVRKSQEEPRKRAKPRVMCVSHKRKMLLGVLSWIAGRTVAWINGGSTMLWHCHGCRIDVANRSRGK